VKHPLLSILRRQKAGIPAGCASTCSALPQVLEAAPAEASDAGTLALIESTSNQVNQFGGYTGNPACIKTADLLKYRSCQTLESRLMHLFSTWTACSRTPSPCT
jgi:tagatose-1,6-bisphosphate aldolase non-catalytic subunit AgaZ/GatZ